MLAFLFVVSWLVTETTLVCGLNFTLSKTRVILGTTGKLSMTCDVTEMDASVVYDVQIRRDTSTKWETLAFIQAGETEVPSLNKHIVDDKDFVVDGILDKDNPLNTHLTLQMNIEKMTYDDVRVYKCEMAYKSNIYGSTVSIERNSTLFFVSGLNFTLSKTRVIAGTTGMLFMTCDVIETDASVVHIVQIRRERSTGWETLAYIEADAAETPALNSNIVNDKDFAAGGILDKETPLNTYLSLEMNIKKMTYDDAGVYKCEMSYKSKINGNSVSVNRDATLLIVDTLQDSECVSTTTSVIVGVILGVAIIFISIYAIHVTVAMRIRDRTRHCGRCEVINAAPKYDTSEIQNSSDEV